MDVAGGQGGGGGRWMEEALTQASRYPFLPPSSFSSLLPSLPPCSPAPHLSLPRKGVLLGRCTVRHTDAALLHRVRVLLQHCHAPNTLDVHLEGGGGGRWGEMRGR